MESNMKKVFQYMTTLLLLLVVGTSCEEGNDNWRIITDAQPGAYITGDATIYSATATSSQLVAAPLAKCFHLFFSCMHNQFINIIL